MKVTLLGLGGGTAATLTEQGRQALEGAELVVGAGRLLEGLPPGVTGRRVRADRAREVREALDRAEADRVCVVYSGDTGFHSGARTLLPLLEGLEVEVLPGISCVQTMAAALGRPWQDWRLVSAHGVDCDPVYEVTQGAETLFLTDGKNGPARLCQALVQAGLEELPVAVGEDLTYPAQRVRRGTAGECAGQTFSPLSVLLVEPAPSMPRRTPGWPDGEFVRGEGVPMTKQEVRAALLSKLAVGPEDVFWDIGAGTGSVSVELAALCRGVWAVERDRRALALLRQNREKFHAYRLRVVEGEAPEALAGLPAPDGVFVGGSSGRLPDILRAACRANPAARICVSAVALETLHVACRTLEELGRRAEVTQLAVSRSRPAGQLHLLLANNPVFLVTGVEG